MAGLATVLGSGAMTNSIEDSVQAKAFLILGSNTTEAHPVLGAKIKRALRAGSKLVVADPRRTELARLADVHLQLKPGTDVALLNSLLHVLIAEDLVDYDYIQAHTENFEAVKAAVAPDTPEFAAELTGVKAEDIRRAARIYGEAETAAIFYTMGITQHRTGTDNVKAIANLALATGNLGRPGTGINPLRGQNNVQGACDMGALPNLLPGYQAVTGSVSRAKFQELWGAELPAQPGLTVGEMFRSQLKAMFIMGENPVLSDPDSRHVVEFLQGLDFLVVQDIFLTETAQHAHVVLPGASFAEKEGTFVNTERRVQKVNQAIPPLGDSRPDWQILTDLAKAFGHSWDYISPEDIFAEITQAVPAFAGLSYSRLEQGGIQWPCPEPGHPGTPILHAQGPLRGKGTFSVLTYQGPDETPDEQYPLILTTGRILYHYHTGTMTRNSQGLRQHRDRELLEINAQDAKKYDLADGDMVKICSRRGAIEAEVQISPRVPAGVLFMTFHFRESAANVLTNPQLDPTSKTPELKVAAVRLEKP